MPGNGSHLGLAVWLQCCRLTVAELVFNTALEKGRGMLGQCWSSDRAGSPSLPPGKLTWECGVEGPFLCRARWGGPEEGASCLDFRAVLGSPCVALSSRSWDHKPESPRHQVAWQGSSVGPVNGCHESGPGWPLFGLFRETGDISLRNPLDPAVRRRHRPAGRVAVLSECWEGWSPGRRRWRAAFS